MRYSPLHKTVHACRMKPNYMGPDSPVRREFMEFCAANPMDSKRESPALLDASGHGCIAQLQ